MNKDKHIVVLGGKTKFGKFLSDYLITKNHDVLPLGRDDVDFKSGWITEVDKKIKHRFGGPEYVDMVIINVFDHDDVDTQTRVTHFIWSLMKNSPKVTVVVIGSMAHYYQQSQYALAKRRVRDFVLNACNDNASARLLLVEPAVLENTAKLYPNTKYLKFQELADTIMSASASNSGVSMLQVFGRHAYSA